MRLTFHGAAGEVTGSCMLLENEGVRTLIDCGAFQGGPEETTKNNARFSFDPQQITAVILTHAHFDHCGRLPKLVAEGYEGPIFMTAPTRDLVELVLRDSLRVMETQYRNSGTLPFYREEHLAKMLRQVQTVDYRRWHVLAPKVTFRLHDAGHIFGSAFVELVAGQKSIIFSGDLGNPGAPIIRDAENPPPVDAVVMEATYAGRAHEPLEERAKKLSKALLNTANNHGVLLIPAFAVERTQEILWELHNMADEHKLPSLRFYLDSPLAIETTDVFRRYPSIYDHEATRAFHRHHDFLNFPRLTLARTSEDSKKINTAPQPKVIIAGSGMMDGGRILFHLEHYISRPNTTILVVGYQAEKTLGRQIIDGVDSVYLFGERFPVKAQVIKINAYSAHADQHALQQWLSSMSPSPQTVFLNHGERTPSEDFARHMKVSHNLNAIVPEAGKTYTL